MANFDNKILLSDFLDDFTKTDVDYSEVFYGLSKELEINNKNFVYVPNFNPSEIAINYTNNRQVKYLNVAQMDRERTEELRKSNIKTLVDLSVGMYLRYPWRNGILNHEVLKNNFDAYSFTLPAEDFEYYRSVICDDIFTYYSDYKDKKATMSSSSVDKGAVLVRASNHQTGVIEENDKNKAAFSTSAFLIISFSTVCGLMMVLAYVLAMK